MTMKHLIIKAWLGLVFVSSAIGLLIFGSAGTTRYWQAWVYVFVYFAGSVWITVYLIKRDKALLARRMRGGPTAEKRATQKVIMAFASLGFVLLLVVPGFDHRMQWSRVPFLVTLLAEISIAISWVITLFVFRENRFSSATIEVSDTQKVISTGPYAVVRHPMYAGALLFIVGTPLALGSYWGLLAAAATIPFIVWRLFDEERFLSKNLKGYTEYCRVVRRRLIPGVF
jgi:protein-S-isoprenylcysteine O-methyltransferase Ste14